MVRFNDGTLPAIPGATDGFETDCGPFSVREPAPDSTRHSPPDPFLDLDPIVELEDRIRALSAQIHSATHRLLVLIAEFDRRRGWEMGGHRCCADWLSFRTGIDRGAARERVRAARALTGLPDISDAMARGELSFSQVRALTRVATPDNESELLPLAMQTPASRLERVIRGWRRGSRQDEARREEELHRSRCLSVFPDEDGMYVLRGLLPPELGVLLARAIEAGSDALFREEGRTPEAVDPQGHREAAARRRADAMGLVAERALAAGFGGGVGGCDGDEGDGAEGGEGGGEAEKCAPISGSRAERYQVVLHVEAETLLGAEAAADGVRAGAGGTWAGAGGAGTGAAAPPHSHFHDGTRVSAETCRRLCCDAAVVRVEEGWAKEVGAPRVAEGAGRFDPDGSGRPRRQILSVGRKTRTISPALRRALEIRDQGCRFPGCGHAFTDAHHVRHWADGGETSLANTLLLCRHHHRLVHEGGWSIRWLEQGNPVFVDPRGGQQFDGGWEPPGGEGSRPRG
jgi:hypothetical protein